jgi:sterol desaturase/sphingolipid hydroxylase (fatty acid hydroxylase superfamily)
LDVPRHEPLIRLSCFAVVLLAMALWEALAPRRPLTVEKRRRWLANLALALVSSLAVRFLLPLGAIGAAEVARERQWGVLNNSPAPAWLALAVAVLALDLVVYLQHVMFHAVPLLWRLHRVHHADLDFDATTGVRFHPIEILLSMGIKMAAVVLIGAPALGVLVFEVLLNATSVFNHGNVKLPARLDRLLRLVLVTPEMHRVHHSALPRETNSNFGFNVPWWDFLFGTYRAQPAAGHEGMTIGLGEPRLRDEQTVERLPGILLLPFVGRAGPYPISRGGGRPGEPATAAVARLPSGHRGAASREGECPP